MCMPALKSMALLFHRVDGELSEVLEIWVLEELNVRFTSIDRVAFAKLYHF